MTEVDCSPLPSIIQSVIHEQYKLRVLLAELIDNALDKRATVIRLYRDGDDFIVEDNGDGVSNMLALLQWGNHSKTEGAKTMGRYGIGLKHAAIWLAYGMDVQTRYHNHLYSLTADWQQMIETNAWRGQLADPVQDRGKPYTKIVLGPVRDNRLKTLKSVPPFLSYEYTPALVNGVDIFIGDSQLHPVPLPPLESVIELDEFLAGRHFRLIAGLKTKGSEPQRYGFDVTYRNRLIVRGDTYGTFDYSAQQFYAYLSLLDDGEADWTLSTHKGHFEQCEALYDSIFPYIEPILQAAEELGDQIELDGARGEVLHMMAGIKPIREKRSRRADKTESPTPKSSDTGRRRQNASKTNPDEPGSVLEKQLQGVLDVRFDCHDPEKIGDVQRTKTATIISLNPDFKLIQQRDASTIAAVAVSLLAAHVIHYPEEKSKLGITGFPEMEAENFYLGFTQYFTNMIGRVNLEKQVKAACEGSTAI